LKRSIQPEDLADDEGFRQALYDRLPGEDERNQIDRLWQKLSVLEPDQRFTLLQGIEQERFHDEDLNPHSEPETRRKRQKKPKPLDYHIQAALEISCWNSEEKTILQIAASKPFNSITDWAVESGLCLYGDPIEHRATVVKKTRRLTDDAAMLGERVSGPIAKLEMNPFTAEIRAIKGVKTLPKRIKKRLNTQPAPHDGILDLWRWRRVCIGKTGRWYRINVNVLEWLCEMFIALPQNGVFFIDPQWDGWRTFSDLIEYTLVKRNKVHPNTLQTLFAFWATDLLLLANDRKRLRSRNGLPSPNEMIARIAAHTFENFRLTGKSANLIKHRISKIRKEVPPDSTEKLVCLFNRYWDDIGQHIPKTPLVPVMSVLPDGRTVVGGEPA
jgi:hypothetical protein